MKKVKLIPSYEGIMPLLLDNYRTADLAHRELMLKDLFIPLARLADEYNDLMESKDDN